MVSPGTYLEMARENPAAVAGIALGGLGIVGAMAARSAAEARRRNRPTERLRRGVASAAEGLGETVQQAWAAVPSLPVEVRFGTGDAKEDTQTQPLMLTGSDPGMVKRILWAGLVAVMMAAGGLAARRLSATIWRTAMGEAPPTKNV
jgi:hypothetical protein